MLFERRDVATLGSHTQVFRCIIIREQKTKINKPKSVIVFEAKPQSYSILFVPVRDVSEMTDTRFSVVNSDNGSQMKDVRVLSL